MKNTIEAIKYGMDVLKVSPNKMFSLLESSQGYTGDDYGRWLANEIINIAEKDGVGFSQLLVKKFAIISEILGNVDVSIKQEWLDTFKRLLGTENIVSVNFDEIGTSIEGLDWYSDIDLMFDKGFADKLPKFDGKYAFVAKLESDPCDKSSELFKYAKEHNIICKNKGSLLLHRMCNYVDANQLGSEFVFAFFVNTQFLCDVENRDTLSFFLKYFSCKGFVVDSSELLTSLTYENHYAFIVCTPRDSQSVQDGFVLTTRVLTDEGFKRVGKSKRYSRSVDSAFTDFKADGNVLGSLHFSNGVLKAHSLDNLSNNEVDTDNELPITDVNFREAVVVYAVWWSLRYCGFSTDIKKLLTGSTDFEDLFYNCLPLFLFNTDSYFVGGSTFDVTTSEFIIKMLDEAEVHFSYEAKELMSVCKGFLDFCGDDVKGKTFEDIREEANHDGLNNSYLLALAKLKEYICSMYRRME